MHISGEFKILDKRMVEKEGRPSYLFIQAGDMSNFEKVTFSIQTSTDIPQKVDEVLKLSSVPCVVRSGKFGALVQLKP